MCVTAVIALGPLTFSGPHGPTAFRPATRLLVVLIAVGVVVLYPLIRLSQASAGRPLRAAVHDLAVLLAPASVVVITSASRLARWPLGVALAAAGVLAAWSLVAVGLTTLGVVGVRSRSAPLWRAAAVLSCLVATLGGLALAKPTLRAPGAPSPVSRSPTGGWMASAPGAMYEVVRDRAWTGRFAAVSAGHWGAIGVTAGVGVCVLGLAGVLSRVGGSSATREPASVAVGASRAAASVGTETGQTMESITEAEKKQIEERLASLKANRSAITERIAEARAMGDLKENAEYHAAREQQGLEEAEIRRLEERLASANVVNTDMANDAGVVFIGSTVRLRDTGNGREGVYRLVGEPTDADDDEVTEVTSTSPMGEALMKARIGETIRVKAPRGLKRFEVVELL